MFDDAPTLPARSLPSNINNVVVNVYTAHGDHFLGCAIMPSLRWGWYLQETQDANNRNVNPNAWLPNNKFGSELCYFELKCTIKG